MDDGAPSDFSEALRGRLVDNLRAHPRTRMRNHSLRRAAVAVAVVPGSRGAAFVLTRRSSSLRAHPFQFALPGGHIDAGETPEQAARRELSEEVMLEAGPDSVLGSLDDYETRSGYVITPIVVWVSDVTTLRAQRDEVDQVHVIDLAELDRPDSPRWINIDESDKPLIQVPLQDRVIHAPTAAMLYQFREVAVHGRLVRTDQIEEPVWAWR